MRRGLGAMSDRRERVRRIRRRPSEVHRVELEIAWHLGGDLKSPEFGVSVVATEGRRHGKLVKELKLGAADDRFTDLQHVVLR